jgi:hypothetical protein
MSVSDLKNTLANNVKNLIGWRTKRKIIVFSVDDYGNVRLDSKKAREEMENAGVKAQNRFDRLDTLETRQDLEMLYQVLRSVRDKNGRHAVFTPFALPCNINFEEVLESGFNKYQYELLPETFQKLTLRQPEAYDGAWEMLNEGIDAGLMVPQFHGREHLNLKMFEEMLQKKDPQLINVLKNRSYTGITNTGYETISQMAEFDFWKFEENERFDDIIRDGLNRFEQVYGYRSVHFTPPAGREHPVIHKALKENGIHYIDTPLIKKEHQGEGKYKKIFNYTGKRNRDGLYFIVRNVVFEPIDPRGFNWVDHTMRQIEAAFRWNRPAIISSHRVNFCGHIDEKNREKGLNALRELLMKITNRWPDVEFMAANELGDLISRKMA